MFSSFPALQVLLPLVGAPLCLLLSRFGRFAWILAITITWCVAAMCFLTFSHIYATGMEITYFMGGWSPPFGIEYRIDLLGGMMLVLVSGMAAVVVPSMFASANHEITREKQPYYYAAYLLFLAGMLGIISTHDAFNLYVFLEISSLASYALIAMGRDKRALVAAFQCLILGTIGATFLLIGIGLLYIMTGTLNMSDLASRIGELEMTRPIFAAFAFIAIGLCLKAALFPLHTWLPNAYAYAPSPISALLASVATKVGVYTALRFFYSLFGYSFSFEAMQLKLIISALAIGAITVGSLVAIFQTSLKRMLAFSSVAQIGYITLGISLASLDGLTASLLHMINHAVMKGGLFLALSCMAYRLGSSVAIDDIRGMGRHMPLTSLGFALLGLGLIGVPLTAGFISKWVLLTSLWQGGWWIAAVAVLLGSLLTIVYIWRVVEALYFGRAKESNAQVVEAPASMVFPVWILVCATLWLGVHTEWNLGVAHTIANDLMGTSLMGDEDELL